MSITSRTTVDQIEVTNALAVQVRLARLIEETAADGTATELSRMYHRMNVERDGPRPMQRLDEVIADVSAHLAEMGWPEIDPDGLERVRRVARAAWRTPAKTKGA